MRHTVSGLRRLCRALHRGLLWCFGRGTPAFYDFTLDGDTATTVADANIDVFFGDSGQVSFNDVIVTLLGEIDGGASGLWESEERVLE